MWLEYAQIAGMFFALFLVSVAGSFAVGRARRKRVPAPPVNTKLRLRKGAAQFGAYLVESNSNDWTITAPVQMSGVGTLAPSGELLCDYPSEDGLTVFWSRIIGRPTPNSPYVLIAAPSRILIRDRRAHPRVTFVVRKPALANDRPGVFVQNLCPGGARLAMTRSVPVGSDIEVRLKGHAAPLNGVVLDCRPIDDGLAPYAARIRFDQEAPLDLVHELSA